MPRRRESNKPLLSRLAWFALLWLLGVTVLGTIAWAIRLALMG